MRFISINITGGHLITAKPKKRNISTLANKIGEYFQYPPTRHHFKMMFYFSL